MNKKDKKRVALLREKQQKLQRLLSDARKQCDDEREVQDLERQLADLQREVGLLTAEG